ncbi:MAG: hypothetical protein Q8L37_03740 [Candidatus Gottesmanbacteria bacterium]|nr:hypothetical protein [Candidatus Gottesmanbacteria bacterium]
MAVSEMQNPGHLAPTDGDSAPKVIIIKKDVQVIYLSGSESSEEDEQRALEETTIGDT